VTISDMTLHGPQLHGAIFSWFHTGLHLHHLRLKETLWSGLRTFGMKKAKIHDCEFVDAGGRWDKGQPGVKGGITGGGSRRRTSSATCGTSRTSIAGSPACSRQLGTRRIEGGGPTRLARRPHRVKRTQTTGERGFVGSPCRLQFGLWLLRQ